MLLHFVIPTVYFYFHYVMNTTFSFDIFVYMTWFNNIIIANCCLSKVDTSPGPGHIGNNGVSSLEKKWLLKVS